MNNQELYEKIKDMSGKEIMDFLTKEFLKNETSISDYKEFLNKHSDIKEKVRLYTNTNEYKELRNKEELEWKETEKLTREFDEYFNDNDDVPDHLVVKYLNNEYKSLEEFKKDVLNHKGEEVK